MSQKQQIRRLLNRLARLDAGDGWSDGLNPSQRAAVEYLAQANRFSRSPSHVADYLGTTRGTMSQTLKALVRKGFVAEEMQDADKRSISYCLTDEGEKVAATSTLLMQSFDELSGEEIKALARTLLAVLHKTVATNGRKPFGVCKDCTHYRQNEQGGLCSLLNVALEVFETEQICHEQEPT